MILIMITGISRCLVIILFTFFGSLAANQHATSESLHMSIGRAVIDNTEKPFLKSQYQPFPKSVTMRVISSVYNGTIFLTRHDVSLPVIYRRSDGSRSWRSRNETCGCNYRPHVPGAFSFCEETKGFLKFPHTTVHIDFLNASFTKGFLPNAGRTIYSINVTEVGRRVGNAQFRPFRRKRSIHFSPFTPFVVNLLMITDSTLFEQYGGNTRRIISRVVSIMNIVNTAYRPFNVTFAVVGLEIWSHDLIHIDSNNPNDILHRLERYKRDYHAGADCIHMLVGQRMRTVPKGEPIGRARLNTMCSTDSCVAFSLDSQRKTDFETALVVAHELGHNFGMAHDRQDTDCQTCIMSPSMEYARLDLTWSQKSLETMRDVIELGLDRCLRDQPRQLDSKMKSRCGNGIVEDGEECDCGTQESCVRSRCCDFKTCKLVRGAECATGACCDHRTCRRQSRGFTCRPARGTCDLPEFCDGKTEYCPANRVKNNGVSCYNSGEAYCYNGDCQTRQSWCRVLWGPTGRVGAHSCFEENRRGSRFAHCHSEKITRSQRRSANWGGQVACQRENVLCGRLWCDHMNEKVMFYGVVARTSISDHAGSWCDAIVADLGPKRRDPGMVPDGASCGTNKACLNSTCVPAARLNRFKNCDCNGRGVCNDLGHCHCQLGFAPPDCRTSGYGGSVDSGPPPTALEKMIPMIVVLVCLIVIFLAVAAIIGYICVRYRQRLAAIKFQYRRDEGPPPYSAVPAKPSGGGGVGGSPGSPEVQFKKANGAAPGDSRIKFTKSFGKSKKRPAEEDDLRGPAPQPPPKPVSLKLNIASRTPESPSPATPPLPPFPKIYADPAALENGHVASEAPPRPKPTISSPIFQTSTNPALDDLPTLDRHGVSHGPPPPTFGGITTAATPPPPPPPPAFAKPSATATPTPPPPPNFGNPLAAAVLAPPPPPPPQTASGPGRAASFSKSSPGVKSAAGLSKAPSSAKSTTVGVSKAPSNVSKTPSSVKNSPGLSKAPSSVSASRKTPSTVSKASSSVSKAPSSASKAPSSVSKAPSSVSKAPSSVSKAPSSVSKAPSSVSKAPSKAFGASRTVGPPQPPPASAKPTGKGPNPPPPPPPPSYGKAPNATARPPPSKASGGPLTSRLPPAPNSAYQPPPPPPPPSTKPGAKYGAGPPPPPPPATAKPPVTSSYRRY